MAIRSSRSSGEGRRRRKKKKKNENCLSTVLVGMAPHLKCILVVVEEARACGRSGGNADTTSADEGADTVKLFPLR